jgi:ABC-type dipeptide/oligopeptide/nickel transport system permease subunit
LIVPILFLVFATYSIFYPAEETNRYRNHKGELLRWSSAKQPCVIEIDYDNSIEGFTPILGTDKNGLNYAYYLSRSLVTNLSLSLLSVITFIIIAVSCGIFVGYDSQHRKINISINDNGISSLWSRNNIGLFMRYFVESGVRTLHAIPQLLLLIIVVVVSYRSLENDLTRMCIIMIFIGILSAPKLIFLIVDRITILEGDEFINAARASGLADSKIIFKHILFYDSSPVIFAQIIYVIVQAIMLETVISFLGYGMGMVHSSIGGLISQFRYDLPGSVGGNVMALYPMILLLLIALAGNTLTKSFMEMRSD